MRTGINFSLSVESSAEVSCVPASGAGTLHVVGAGAAVILAVGQVFHSQDLSSSNA